jgi:hypothetical protein
MASLSISPEPRGLREPIEPKHKIQQQSRDPIHAKRGREKRRRRNTPPDAL